MRCNKCGANIPDNQRFCPVCGHKLQSGHQSGALEPDGSEDTGGAARGNGTSRLLDFQGWARTGRGLGRYIEACAYGTLLVAGVAWYVYSGMFWPLYPILAICALAAWLRRL
ncbi:conserved hypothetical protein [Solidesulfovibrio fructosivorans JJ]]|uniref:Zinc-ribbon domain-containing protein n=1 Tax=Solidesulfovibrio fructosivorans JJ] TaxID=596151 RepID=E1K1T5_SOLFR|nr:zinc ribbon domain-containing protein [Solidesulfovibrio fructosivorans]EFL49435.1 conserved hypothetical protein [Solidesulfovibrio fructosivorans JJ]]